MFQSWLNDELRLLSDQVARFIRTELEPRAERWRQDGCVDRDTWRKASEAGLLCASIPETYGGGGGTRAHEAVIHQELSRAGMGGSRSEEHTSELQSLMRISYAVFCLKKKKIKAPNQYIESTPSLVHQRPQHSMR